MSPDKADTILLSVGTAFFESIAVAGSRRSLGNPGQEGWMPLVRTNDRAAMSFDFHTRDTQLWRASRTTPANPSSTAASHPAGGSWANIQTGGHWDVGYVAFEPMQSVNACPILFSEDGGIYFDQNAGPSCHDVNWEQPA